MLLGNFQEVPEGFLAAQAHGVAMDQLEMGSSNKDMPKDREGRDESTPREC